MSEKMPSPSISDRPATLEEKAEGKNWNCCAVLLPETKLGVILVHEPSRFKTLKSDKAANPRNPSYNRSKLITARFERSVSALTDGLVFKYSKMNSCGPVQNVNTPCVLVIAI